MGFIFLREEEEEAEELTVHDRNTIQRPGALSPPMPDAEGEGVAEVKHTMQSFLKTLSS